VLNWARTSARLLNYGEFISEAYQAGKRVFFITLDMWGKRGQTVSIRMTSGIGAVKQVGTLGIRLPGEARIVAQVLLLLRDAIHILALVL